MSYVFVSHASSDKRRHVRPLVLALAYQGLRLWIDRPGMGDDEHLGLDRDTISRFGIREIAAGSRWDQEIDTALRECGVILACFSEALREDRRILNQEIAHGHIAGKLVACIVDDLDFDALNAELGLPDLSRTQARRIDTARLAEAVDLVFEALDPEAKEGPDQELELLSPPCREQWGAVQDIAANLRSVLRRRGMLLPSKAEIEAAVRRIASVPIEPSVRTFEIPPEVEEAFCEASSGAPGAQQMLHLATKIRKSCNPEDLSERQILVRDHEVPDLRSTALEPFWTSVLSLAGGKSRRTLAALIVALLITIGNGSPHPHRELLDEFLHWLEHPELN